MLHRTLLAQTVLVVTVGSGKSEPMAIINMPAKRTNTKLSNPSSMVAPLLMLGLGGIVVALSTTPALGQASFQGLSDLPGGSFASAANSVSANGAVVVGSATSASGGEAFRWTSGGGMVGLGDLPGGIFGSRADAVSADGLVVVGLGSIASGSEAFRWTTGGGIVGLGDLPGGSFSSSAFGTSADGSVVVGSSSSGTFQEAFLWTSGGGMVGLGDLAGGIFRSGAFAISADGSVVVGRSMSASGGEAFRWTTGGGMVGLGSLPGSDPFLSEAFATSADGAVIVGRSASGTRFEAFRWTSGGGMVGIGDLPGGDLQATAMATSADGSLVVGIADSASGHEAFLWTPEAGMRSLMDILIIDFGLDLTGWKLVAAAGVSADGMTIVGGGINPDGFNEAWIVTLPVPICGNGIVEPGEACDDGNADDTDACLSTCQVNPSPVPTVSQWGLLAMALLMLTAGTIVCARRQGTLA